MAKPNETVTNTADKLKEKENPLNQFLHAADKTGQAMLHEVQQDWQKTGNWVKTHPREDGMIVGGAIILAGAALYIKDRKDGAAAIAEGERIMRGEQVVAETASFAKSGSESHITSTIEYGNKTKANLWLDPNSAAGRRLLDQNEGLGGSFRK